MSDLLLPREAEKSYFLNGSAIKKGGRVKGLAWERFYIRFAVFLCTEKLSERVDIMSN